MKRTVPLLITGIVGFVLIVSFFIPATEGWGEVAAVWFDILASIAFVLGGGNLLKVHLKKTSDRARGWGYSVITLVAFLTMLLCGLFKIGSPPAPIQEYFGQTFAELSLEDLPVTYSVDGRIPEREGEAIIPASVRAQLRADEAAGTITFRGWMRNNQKDDLLGYKNDLSWRCAVEKLAEKAVPPELLKGKVNYYADHSAVAFSGAMSDEQYEALKGLGDSPDWLAAVEKLHAAATTEHSTVIRSKPDWLAIPDGLPAGVTASADATQLTVKGPMTSAQRAALTGGFPKVRAYDEAERAALLQEIEQQGSLNAEQVAAFNKVMDSVWTVQQFEEALNEAGRGLKEDRKACDMLADLAAGAKFAKPKTDAPPDVKIIESQRQLLRRFADDPDYSVEDLKKELDIAAEFTDKQGEAVDSFMDRQPTQAELERMLAIAMLKAGPLSEAQREMLFDDYRAQLAWRDTVQSLFEDAHDVKYGWSGAYRAYGSPFWWLYEYAFKPLTATMFAMLAFYVASAAFRAFRAKNLEAILLLGTAFIILLGRTFAGVFLTSWIDPEGPFSGLRLENMTVTIMSVFNTAGNRAIMIGIALGIASTSLKVLLGVDRSYLGKE